MGMLLSQGILRTLHRSRRGRKGSLGSKDAPYIKLPPQRLRNWQSEHGETLFPSKNSSIPGSGTCSITTSAPSSSNSSPAHDPSLP